MEKNYCNCKKDCSWNLSTCICENSNYQWLRVMKLYLLWILYQQKEKYCSNGFFSDTIIVLSIILLLTITIICYHYAKHRSKQKGIDALTI